MAHLLRGKLAGIQTDLSAGVDSTIFNIDDLARYGINSQVSCLAYDPVQSLLAVGTRSSQFGPGQIYVFGRKRIQVTLSLPPRGATVKELQFCANRLICLDTKHELSVYSLELKAPVSSHIPSGATSTLCTDPTLDYAFLGMQNGEVLAYDLDRQHTAPFKIPMLWKDKERGRLSPVVSLQLHPRDIGTLLIGYPLGAVIYSFKLNTPLRHFSYEIPRGATGGDGDPASLHVIRKPRLTQATWHPTGTFIMTCHEDSSIVFWDTVKDGRMLMARTLTDTNVATPGGDSLVGAPLRSVAMKEPLFRVAWCANIDPEDTAIIMAGGASTKAPMKGLTMFEMGRTPVYATSTWDVLTKYFENPKRQRILPTPPGAEVIDFCLIPRSSPHFAGAHDPIAVIALMSSGELLTLTFPSGLPIIPTNQLHLSLSFIHPFLQRINVTQVERQKWLGLQERRSKGPDLLKGGAEASRRMRKSDSRSIVQSIHADGTIRLFDAGLGDEVENERVIQVDCSRAVGRFENVQLTHTSFAGESGELAVGLASGEFLVFRWGVNRNAGREPPSARPNQRGALMTITDRTDPSLNEGLMPFAFLDQADGPVTSVKTSDIGFVAAGFEGGSIITIDLRGPAVIYSTSIQDLIKDSGRGPFKSRRSSVAESKPEWATDMEFSIMTLEGEDYSSILLHVGTNLGRLATFQILPDPSGRYTAQYAGSIALDSKIMHIAPISAENGSSTVATRTAMASLRDGHKVDGALVVATPTSVYISRPATQKGAHKSFDNVFCDAAGIVSPTNRTHVFLGLFGDGTARAYSLPALREIVSLDLTAHFDVRRFHEAAITPTGSIIAFTGPSELAQIDLFGSGESRLQSPDHIFNPEALIPPRPTISNVQWITGTQYITPADMDILVGGPNRPPSKRMIEQARAEEAERRKAVAAGAGSSRAGAAGQQNEGYWAYMQRQVQERTEQLGFAEDSMNRVEENSASWAEDVNKYVNKQKRGVATSCECWPK